jgi:acetyltransferase-like isoleucine patch superfamily enzyme
MIKDKNGKNISSSEFKFKILNRLNNYCLDFELCILYLIGTVPSHHIRRFFYRLAGIKIGKGSSIHTYLRFFDPKNIEIGDDTIIGDHVFLDGRDKLVIGNHTDIASYVLIYNSQHDVDSTDFRAVLKPIVIGDYVFIGPRAIILPGVTLGKGAVVAAGAVVTCDVGEFEVVGGIPAIKIRERNNKNPSYILGRARLFQ